MELFILMLSGAILIMFIIMFVFVIKTWNLHKEILHSGGYPTVSYFRAKRDAIEVIEGRTPWDYEINEIIEILSRHRDDPEATELVQRLTALVNKSDNK